MSYEPAYSPWGLIQTHKTLCPGFFDVSTASHGGIMVAREFITCRPAVRVLGRRLSVL